MCCNMCMAPSHYITFAWLQIATGTFSVTALESVFDLLYVYGLSMFGIEDPDEGNL